MPSATDVREWARSQGIEVADRGNLKRALWDEYAAAHPDPGPDPAGEGPGDYDGGVTEADFPDPEPGSALDDETWTAEAAPAEQPPRRPAAGRRWRPRRVNLFGQTRPQARKAKARIPLDGFAENMWGDLAQVAPWPPLQMILAVQAPYAAAVFDDAVTGTFIDPLLQPLARADQALRALDGLLGPPLITAMICVAGRREENPDGSLGDYDPRTKIMFAMLKYSLMQMSKVSDVRTEDIEAKAAAMTARAQQADALIALMFPPAGPPAGQEPGPAEAEVRRMGDRAGAPMPGFIYPPPPGMTADGADPGRMG